MNSRERLLTAMTGGKPDRVACTPDFSNMIPCRLTGKPFWDIYLHNDPPLWQAYLEAADYFGIDGWFMGGRLDFQHADDGARHESEIVSRTAERIVQRTRLQTPTGEWTSERTYYVGDPPTATEKPIKTLGQDNSVHRRFFRAPTGYSTETARAQKALVGDRYAFGTCVGYPGFQSWLGMVEGGVAPLAYAQHDCPEILEEWREWQELASLKTLEMVIDSGLFDYVLLGGSGSISLASPDLFDRYALPTIQKQTRMCTEAGLPTMLHSCGLQKHLVKRCAKDTDLNCVNPLEPPPMGDCDLAEIKRLYGDQIALMGNLHTTDVMLRGTVETVEREARKCLEAAADGGGFILSTGDQCGRDTPDENIRKLVEVCEVYGRYD